jgi:zinc transport system substrate-binding protein
MSLRLVLTVVFISFAAAVSAREAKESLPLVCAGMHPYAGFVEAVGKGVVRVESILPASVDPHISSLAPSQIRMAESSELIFLGNMPFESLILDRFKDKAVALESAAHHHHSHDHSEHCAHGDAHPWMNLPHAEDVSRAIADKLAEKFPEAAPVIEENLNAWIGEIEALESGLLETLRPLKGKKVLVHHPAWSAFFGKYGIEQVALEVEGKPISARRMSEVVASIDSEFLPIILVTPFADERLKKNLESAFGFPVHVSDAVPSNYLQELKKLGDVLIEAAARK